MSPSGLLEPIFTTHGDTLYRVALLLEPHEHRAARLLHALAADLINTPPLTPPTDADLLARLITLARIADARPKQQRRPTHRSDAPAIYRSLLSQPLDARMALGLHVLLGYDPGRIAVTLGSEPAAASRLLEQAMRTVAPAAGRDIPDRVSSDHCYAVRTALIDTTSRERHSSAVRSHLAGCAACRSFDQRWIDTLQLVEAAVRQELRPRQMPVDLLKRLSAYDTPRTGDQLRPYRFALPLIAVLVFVAALVVPGFSNRAVTIVDRTNAPTPVDPNTLLRQALDLHAQPPSTGPAIWHGRFETLWYFDERTVAPLYADLWLDRDNPARHRIQVTHRDGGAPYELQVGNGADRLHYALDAAYAPVLYGPLNTGALPERPRLTTFNSAPTEQSRALNERLHAGPWAIPLAYIEQALNATDVRVLGRQRDGERTVQIISFSGVSPLSLPERTAERVTILLALDNDNGRLRSATELIGPPGGTQVSRITWRLNAEEQFEGELLSRRAFTIDSAWNGLGEFTTVPPQPLADPALPFLSAAVVGDPAMLVGEGVIPTWMPATAPTGIDRALMIGGTAPSTMPPNPEAIVYLGPQRRLTLRYGRAQPLVGETLTVGVWNVTLRPNRGGVYNAFLQRNPQHRRSSLDPGTTQLVIEARNIPRDDLLAIIADLRPLDLESLIAQDALFAAPKQGDAAARATLLALVRDISNADPNRALYVRWRTTHRLDPQIHPPRDPYSPQLYAAIATAYELEHWLLPDVTEPALLTRITALPSARTLLEQYYGSDHRLWIYDALSDTTSVYRLNERLPLISRLPAPFALAFSLLTDPEANATLVQTGDGAQLIEGRIAADPAGSYLAAPLAEQRISAEGALADLQPATLAMEFELSATGELETVRVFGEAFQVPGVVTRPERVLIDAYELVERNTVPLNEAPPAFRIPTPPVSSLTRDFSGLQAPFPSERPTTLNETIILAPFPLYELPQTTAELRTIEQNLFVAGMNYRYPFYYPQDDLQTAIEAGLAVRFTYELPAGPGVRMSQGPAAALRAYLRSSPQPIWEAPEPITLTIGDQEVTGWIGARNDQSRLIVEIFTQLLIIDGPTATLVDVLPLLNELQLSPRSS
jgi:hypothetical protein